MLVMCIFEIALTVIIICIVIDLSLLIYLIEINALVQGNIQKNLIICFHCIILQTSFKINNNTNIFNNTPCI